MYQLLDMNEHILSIEKQFCLMEQKSKIMLFSSDSNLNDSSMKVDSLDYNLRL